MVHNPNNCPHNWTIQHVGEARSPRRICSRCNLRYARYITNAPSDKEVDHIDGDTLNDDPSNLRICTHEQNTANKKPQKGGTSKYKGVSLHKATGKWQVRVKGKTIGYYSNERTAAIIYNLVAKAEFGEFARLNEV